MTRKFNPIHGQSGRLAQVTHLRFATLPDVAKYGLILARNLGMFRRPTAKLVEILRIIGYYDIPEEVMIHLRTRKPRLRDTEHWKRVRQIVEDAVSVTAPQTTYSAGTLQTAAAKFLEWALLDQRLPFEGERMFSRQLIDMFVNDKSLGLSEGTRRNYRAQLNRISEALVPEEHAFRYTPPQPKDGSNPVYRTRKGALSHVGDRTKRASEAPTRPHHAHPRCWRWTSLIRGRDDLSRTRDDHRCRHPHRRSRNLRRSVPLVSEWEEWMLAILKNTEPGKLIWGPTNRDGNTNLLSSFVENSANKKNGPAGNRLRNTWIVWHMNNRTPLRDLFYAAGVRKMDQLTKLIPYCDTLPSEQYLAILSGRATR